MVYFISDDFYLHSILVNNGYQKIIEILRTGNNYCTIYSKK